MSGPDFQEDWLSIRRSAGPGNVILKLRPCCRGSGAHNEAESERNRASTQSDSIPSPIHQKQNAPNLLDVKCIFPKDIGEQYRVFS